MMPARDTYYKALQEDVERDLAEQQRTSPRAFALRTQMADLYQRLPIGNPTGDLALRCIDYLNDLIGEQRDIAPCNEANLRACLRLDWPR